MFVSKLVGSRGSIKNWGIETHQPLFLLKRSYTGNPRTGAELKAKWGAIT